jgi:serine phosphatase RsbU (regulator of sigma subunit)
VRRANGARHISPGTGLSWRFKLVNVTLPADPLAQLKVAELAVARLEAERDRLEAIVVRLGGLAAELDAEGLVQGVTEAARDLTGAELAMFVPTELAALSQPTIVCEPGALSEAPEPSRVPLLAGALWRVSPVRLDDALQADAGNTGYGRFSDGKPFRSWVGAPVRARYGDALGGLFLAHHCPQAFGRREEEMAQGLAAHLGASLDNLTIFRERSGVARALQQTLLPPELPDIPGVDAAVRYRPAKSMALVGGDFYDIFEVRPGVWNLIIGDVSGVGPEAAALTGIARYAVRALASQEASPAKILSQLNDTLVRFGLQDRFCTMLYAELRLDGDLVRVKIANGGHPYPYLLRADGWLEELEVHGTLLGMLPEISLEEREVELAPGDLLVGYTDGVTEARDPSGAFFGPDGLANVLAGCATRPAAWVAQRIELAVLEYQAGVTPDDVAIVVLQATPEQVG